MPNERPGWPFLPYVTALSVDKEDPTKLNATIRFPKPLNKVFFFVPWNDPPSDPTKEPSMTDTIEQSADKFSPGTPSEAAAHLKAAKTAHEVNRTYCREIGDVVQVPFEELHPDRIASLLKGVAGIVAGNTPEMSHILWLKTREEQGWKYGPVQDAEKKEHPCMVPFDKLPDAQRMKDTLFRTAVLGSLASQGIDIP